MRFAISFLIFTAMSLLVAEDCFAKEASTALVPPALMDYVNAEDDAFAWKIRSHDQRDGCDILDIDLTSQKWQGITWKHALSAFVPENIQHPETVLLFITGGSIGNRPDNGDLEMGIQLSKLAQAPCVFLHQVPNQPLMGGRVEDDLITETFLRYLDTKDKNWPLLFPMVKSAVRAMDAIEELAEQEYGGTIKKFVVTGASKRGWTTWLSAVADERVAGIAPIVIDTLNLRPQMEHQMKTWGEYSEQIADYTSKGLVDVMLNHPEVPLWRWVDPFTYRHQLKLPKLLINGTNDRYWVVDAMNMYWDDLVGEKHVLYVPNAGHGLGEGKKDALTTLAVFTQHVAMGKSLPNLTWKHDDEGDQLRLTVHSVESPEAVQLWVAHATTKDFRPAKWTATSLAASDNGDYVALVDAPKSGHVAMFAEATYQVGPISYGLSTQIRSE